MSSGVDLLDLASKLSGTRVLCIGDIMLDRYVYGRVERISPEAPIPILGVEREETMLGGVGNVVRNVAGLGADVDLIATVGIDPAGDAIQELLSALETVRPTLIRDEGRRTSIKTRFLAGTQQLMRADEETTGGLLADAEKTLIDTATAAMEDCSIVILSDYGKGVLQDGMAAKLIAAARDKDKPIIVDPKGSDYSIYHGATVLTPNRYELSEATRLPTTDDSEVVTAAKKLIELTSADVVLATRGRDGMTIVTASGDVNHLPAEAQDVFDVSGAGDTVVATLGVAMAAGAGLKLAAELTNVAAGIVVAKIGTAAVYTDDLIGALHHRDMTSAESKVMALEPAQDRIQLWRQNGLKVGFTNGCFDLLHPGHLTLLRKSRAACDRLVVGLNSDASVKALKGDDRPIQSEAARATVLASLEAVDLVVIYGDETPIKLIEAIRPDLLVKGSDWTIETVVGAREVQNCGGKVLLVDLEEGHSTTSTIARMTDTADS